MKQLYPLILLLLIIQLFSGCSYSSSSHIIQQSIGYLDAKGDLSTSFNADISRTDLGLNMNGNYALTDRTGIHLGTSIYGSELHPMNLDTDNSGDPYTYASEDFELKGGAIQASIYGFNKIGRLGYLQYGSGVMKSFNKYTDKFSLRKYTVYRYDPWSALGNAAIGLKSKVICASIGMKMMYTWYGEKVPIMTKLDYSFRRKEDQLFSLQPYYDIKLGSGPFNWLIQSGVEFYPFKSYGTGKFNLYYAVGLNYIFEINSTNEVKKPREIQL